MDRIYEVKLQYPYDHTVYFVRAADVAVAASLALQADEASESGKALKADQSAAQAPRVVSVNEFCSTEQIVG